ncbi:MAG: phenylacetic acid degradation protein [Rhodospirillaceae bacterium]|nr:phenylacetic acid degradation protein [Rhodospirillaceae bacterium]|tara:strand:+ start:345 stop:818 length:474 start_codon:yes stop_codon:yes gene_type:complete
MDKTVYQTIPQDQIRAISGLEFLQRIIRGDLPEAPFLKLVGARMVFAEEGKVVVETTPSTKHYNPLNVAHGGFATTVLDTAMGCAVQTTCGAGTASTTLELKINLVRAITANVGKLRAEGQVIHRGKTTATAEGRLVDSGGKLLAHANCTCLVVEVR